ncbi:MAG: DAK2 domain-containing protein [Acidimicrobiales bacterium]
MTPLERLGPADLRAVMARYRAALEDHREAINRLNVYPVPDGDTGTNMALTVGAVVRELDQAGAAAEPDMAATCRAMSHGSLMGARGNSGVILSQVLGGLATTWGAGPAVDGPGLAQALAAATDGAYGAVMEPVEGTILTVVAEAAEAATARAEGGGSLVDVLDAARASAHDALEDTPKLLAVLAEAGVVDAGGAGFLLLLDAALEVVAARPVPEPEMVPTPAAVEAHLGAGAGAGPPDLRYEVMYLLDAPDGSIPAFKEAWADIGGSIAVVGGDGTWNCHIHTDDIGAAIEAGIERGRPRAIRVTDLSQQVEEERWVREAAAAVPEDYEGGEGPVTTAVVAVGAGEGMERILRSLGAHAMVTGGQSMNPSVAQLLEAVESCPADEVVILPNNPNVVAAAEQVPALTAKVVRVVPTRVVLQGFAALLAFDRHSGSEGNAHAMAEAAAGVVGGAVARAVRSGTGPAGPVADGDWLGIGPGGIQVVASSVVDATTGLLAALVADDHEVVTLVEGEEATEADTRAIREWSTGRWPGVEVEVHRGDQPVYAYCLGIE